jgi:hypothetical protein
MLRENAPIDGHRSPPDLGDQTAGVVEQPRDAFGNGCVHRVRGGPHVRIQDRTIASKNQINALAMTG